jgi:hypothetical protein
MTVVRSYIKVVTDDRRCWKYLVWFIFILWFPRRFKIYIFSYIYRPNQHNQHTYNFTEYPRKYVKQLTMKLHFDCQFILILVYIVTVFCLFVWFVLLFFWGFFFKNIYFESSRKPQNKNKPNMTMIMRPISKL